MTREEIIRMARGAGCNDEFVKLAPDWLERFAKLVAAAERESVIDIVAMHGGSVEIEAAILARGQA